MISAKSSGERRVDRAANRRVFADAAAMVAALTPSYPVYCLRPQILRRQAGLFLEAFPGRVLYAVKCNPHPRILQALHEGGIRHFDTASLPEIALVREQFRDAHAYFMHPVKIRPHIKTAEHVYDITHFVVDHMDELEKVMEETDNEDLTIFVRLATPELGGAYDLSQKFGATPDEAAALLRRAEKEGYTVGLAFHVGSQMLNPWAYKKALEMAGAVLEQAGVQIQYLDIGGGFPAPYVGQPVPELEAFIEQIEEGRRQLKLRRDCVLMCEPGRALVANGCSLIVQVQLRKGDRLYINDGIYGSLSEPALIKIQMPARLIRSAESVALEPEAGTLKDFTIYGPTCDSFDKLPTPFRLPENVREGDWIE
ncbi:hypothetical protein AUP43_16695, partial [Oceanibaculum pacificum]